MSARKEVGYLRWRAKLRQIRQRKRYLFPPILKTTKRCIIAHEATRYHLVLAAGIAAAQRPAHQPPAGMYDIDRSGKPLLPHLHRKIAPIQRVGWNALFGSAARRLLMDADQGRGC